jgi:tellurite resistance protein TerC
VIVGAGANEALHSFGVSPLAWVLFLAGVAGLLLVDLFVLHRHAHEISTREAAVTSVAWIALGLAFSLVVWAYLGGTAASQYLTGYVIEKSLSVDNVFVWAVIFSYFGVPRQYQHRVLFWGIFGALALRGVFIFAGIALLEAFHWVLYIFGGFLVITAIRVARHQEAEVHPERNPVLRLIRRLLPMTSEYHGQSLFTRADGGLRATPLFAVLILIEATDVVFAVDSVPAILAISRDQFVVFSSNAMAILGLRALYFLLSSASEQLVHLNIGLGVILGFVGVKMLISEWVHIPTLLSLGFIGVALTVTVLASLRTSRRHERAAAGAAARAAEPVDAGESAEPGHRRG